VAIIYLVRISDVSELLESLASVNRYLPGHPWPVVLFHTSDFDRQTGRTDFIAHLQKFIGADNASIAFSERIEFVKLDWQLPVGISTSKDVLNPVDDDRWPGKSAAIVLINARGR
jgi:mannosyltransferase